MKAAISRLDCGERKRFGGLAWAALAGLALGAVCEWLTWEHSAAVAARTDISQIDLDDWSPGHVGMWLGQVGLGEKSPAFEAARIDGDTLFELDVDELADLGIGTPEELNAFHTARQKLAGLKVNARNPTANGFWEYRSVNRQFIAHALPGIAVRAGTAPPGERAVWVAVLGTAWRPEQGPGGRARRGRRHALFSDESALCCHLFRLCAPAPRSCARAHGSRPCTRSRVSLSSSL